MQSDSSSDDEFSELEERYHEAKQSRADGKLDEAAQTFVEVVESDHAKGEWGFRAAKQLYKLAVAQNRPVLLTGRYQQLLAYAVSSNSLSGTQVTKAVRGAIDRVHDSTQRRRLCELAVECLEGTKYASVLFKIKLLLGELLLCDGQQEALERADSIVAKLRNELMSSEGADGSSKSSELWDVYSLEMRLVRRQGDLERLALLYDRVKRLTEHVNHPKTVAIAHECGALALLSKGFVDPAYIALSEAFPHYEQAMDRARLSSCGSYLILVGALRAPPLGPLDKAVVAALEDNEAIAAAKELATSYLAGGYLQAKAVFEYCQESVRGDDFVKQFLSFVKRRHLSRRMPAEIWIDTFCFFPRRELDPLNTCCRPFRGPLEDKAIPLRPIAGAQLTTVIAPTTMEDRALLMNMSKRDRARHFLFDDGFQRFWHLELMISDAEDLTNARVLRRGPLQDTVQLLQGYFATAYIRTFNFIGHFSRPLVHSIPPAFFERVKIETIKFSIPPDGWLSAQAEARLFKKFFLAFKHLPDLSVSGDRGAHRSFANDAFLRRCIAHGVANLRLPHRKPVRARNYDVTVDAIMRFCFRPDNQGRKRVLHVGPFRDSEAIVARIVQAHKDGATISDPIHLGIGLGQDRRLLQRVTTRLDGLAERRFLNSIDHEEIEYTVDEWTIAANLKFAICERQGEAVGPRGRRVRSASLTVWRSDEELTMEAILSYWNVKPS